MTRFRRLAGITVLAATAAVIAPVPFAGPAVAAETLQCDTAASVYARLPSGELLLYTNPEPEQPIDNWQSRAIGNGWGITRGGPDGRLYYITKSGELHRHRWTGSGWENGGISQVIATNWQGWGDDAARNRMAVDAKGDFYGLPSDNALHWWRYDEAAKTWTERVLDIGWGQKYDMIFASGDGQLFARTPAGQLYSYRYHAESERWLEYARLVGTGGWQAFSDVAGIGGGVFYALDGGAGKLKWYRYLGDGTFANGSGTVASHGWPADWHLEGDSDACKLVGQTVPTRPAVPANFTARNSAVQGDDGLMNYFYVNNAGGLTHAKQRRTSEWNLIDHQAFPDYFKYTGQPSVATHADGKLEVLAHSYDDADVRGKLQAAKNSTWQAGVKTHSGRTLSDPALVKGSDNLMTAFASDGDGKLWYRRQLVLWGAPVQGGYGAWRSLGGDGLTADVGVVRNGDGFEIVARHTDGSVRVARLAGDTLGTWRNLGGTDVTGLPATVVHSDGKLQVVVRRADGKIYTQRETSAGFPGTWQPIDGVTTKGAPAAIVTSRGNVEITVRSSSDSLIHSTGQNVPGGVFREWQVRDLHEAGTEPAMAMLPDDSWAVSWRDPQGEIYTYRGVYGTATAQRSAASESSAPTYTGGKAHS